MSVAGDRSSARPADFSPQAVSRAVLGQTLQRPHVLYPTAVGLLSGLAALVLGPSMMLVAPAVIGLGLGAGGWALDYTLRRDQHAAAYLKRLQAALAGRVSDSIARLTREFTELKFEPGLAQMGQLKAKFDAFEALLRRKLDPQELTYARYRGMTEQVFLGGLDNLTRISDTLKGLSAIDVSHIKRRLHVIATDGVESAQQEREAQALKERLGLLDRQREAVDRWLAENEQAMTQIDHVMAAIATLDTSAAHATMDMESAMSELKALAARAARLNPTS